MTTEEVLQIVHVSDLHVDLAPKDVRDLSFVHGQWMANAVAGLAGAVPGLKRRAKELFEHVYGQWREGTAGHDPRALQQFVRFLGDRVLGDARWRHVPTWIVDTGDLTTFGDDESLAHGQQQLASLLAQFPSTQMTSVHGNHDAWPRRFPLFAGLGEISSHRRQLRDVHFRETHPRLALCAPLRDMDLRIQLYTLNSASHDRITNTLAAGEVKEDQYWRHARRPDETRQVRDLERIVRANNPEGLHKSLRLLAVHHPLSAGAYRSQATMRLRHAKRLARHLGGSPGVGPLAHLILSGHTHRTYPSSTSRLADLNDRAWAPLVHGPRELVVGSLSQHAPLEAQLQVRGEQGMDTMQQFQVLRVRRLGGGDRRHGYCPLSVERRVAVRINNSRRFRYLSELDANVFPDLRFTYDLGAYLDT